jgi:ferrochelatase
LIADRLGLPKCSLAYQSRSGRPSDPWLEPEIGTEIQRLADEGHPAIVVAPIGFVSDHVEVLYDLDIEAKNFAQARGMTFYRVSCPNDHPTFIRMMVDVIEQKRKDTEDRG